MGGNCISRHQRRSRSTTESHLTESGSLEREVELEKTSGAKPSPIAGARSYGGDSDGANPDMVGVTLRCSCDIGCVQDTHLQDLLVNLSQVSYEKVYKLLRVLFAARETTVDNIRI